MARSRKKPGGAGPAAPGAMKPEKAGTINRSQAVSTFGVGAVYELRRYARDGGSLHSVMVAGLDFWDEKTLRRLRERELEKALGVDYFRLPPTEEQFESTGGMCCVPAVRFPRWLVCEKCHRLGRVPDQFEDLGNRGPRCKAADCKGRGFPSRLVTACYNPDPDAEDTQPGHIDDFPWDRWLFQDGERCDNPQLKLESTGSTAGLAGLVASCVCEKHRGKFSRSLLGVFGSGVMDRVCRCWGSRPWLDDCDATECNRKVRAMLRGASNVYFPVTVSAISIPPYSQSLFQILEQQMGELFLNGLIHELPLTSLRNAYPDLQKIRPGGGPTDYVYSDPQITEAIRQFSGSESPPLTSQQEIRTRERRAILEGRPEDDGGRSEFVAEVIPREELVAPLGERFACAVKVHRLREVRALKGFCRVTPPLAGDPLKTRCAPLASKPTRWLPAIEVRGEGIYLEFDPVRVRRWEKLAAVSEREEILRTNTLRRLGGVTPDADSGVELPTARFVLIHTLAHLLMKQLSLDCGYSGASLRERLYVRPDAVGGGEMGLLIYTATPGADGTNGGLVRQGRSERLREVLLAALQNAAWCSSDPLCIEFRGQGTDALNLAACHSCCLVSETSCEYRNTLLDRALVVGLPGRPEAGYFGDLVAAAP